MADNRINLEDLKQQISGYVNDRKVTTLDCDIVTAIALLDIAESLRHISTNTEKSVWWGGPG